MTNLQLIRVGTPDGGGGNTFYEAFIKVNNNFLQLSNQSRADLTNFSALTNVVAAAAVTNVTSYNVTLPAGLNWQAQNDAIIYAKQVLRYSAGAVNMFTNGQLAPIASALSIVYDNLGATSLVDVSFYQQGATVASGTNLPTLRGRIGYGTNIALNPPGIYFNGTNSSVNYWHVPSSSVNHGIAIRQASETNASSSAYQWSYSLVSTSGYNTAMHSSLGWNSSVFYQWVTTPGGGLPNSGHWGLLPRYFNNGSTYFGLSEGLMRGQRQFRNVICTVDEGASATNVTSWVDGVLAQQRATNVLTTAANRIILGHRSDGQFYFRGHINQLWHFNRTLSSNDVVTVDRAMSIAAQEIPVVVYGDSISFFNYDSPKQGFEWSQQMWQELGDFTNRVVIHNHAESGIQAGTLVAEATDTIWHRRPYIGNKNGSHLFILAGVNDLLNSVSATTTFGYVSNLWNIGISNGYTVHACTLLPISQGYASFNLNQASNVMYLNNLIRDTTNNPTRPFTYLWDFNQTVTDTNALTQLFDGIHPTNSVATAMGKMVGTNRNVWLVTP